jgi:hypothetical protein
MKTFQYGSPSMASSNLNRRGTEWGPKTLAEPLKPASSRSTSNGKAEREILDRAKLGEKLVQMRHHGLKDGSYQWEANLPYSRYHILLQLKHPHIVEIDDGEWPHSITDELPLPCVLRVTKPPQPRPISVHDVVMSEGALCISDSHRMCQNVSSCQVHL